MIIKQDGSVVEVVEVKVDEQAIDSEIEYLTAQIAESDMPIKTEPDKETLALWNSIAESKKTMAYNMALKVSSLSERKSAISEAKLVSVTPIEEEVIK